MHVCLQFGFTVLEYAKRYMQYTNRSKVVRLLEKWLHKKVFYELCSLFAYSHIRISQTRIRKTSR